jgi:hypothetical protein
MPAAVSLNLVRERRSLGGVSPKLARDGVSVSGLQHPHCGECGRCVVRAALGHDRIGTYRAGRPARGGATCWTWSKHAVAAASIAA